MTQPFKAINWNQIEEQIDLATWTKLTEQFWLPERVPTSNDIPDWDRLSNEERELFNKVFGGLTALDTLQSEDGVRVILEDVRTQHETAVLTNIQFMESVHARSYSNIFSTLCTPREIDDVFAWTEQNEFLQYKAHKIRDIYLNGTPIQKKIASVFLESFLFYSGFYTPLYYVGVGKMTNVAEIIKLINL